MKICVYLVAYNNAQHEQVSHSYSHLAAGASARPPIDQAQLERELELDLEKVRIEDNIDPSVRYAFFLVINIKRVQLFVSMN